MNIFSYKPGHDGAMALLQDNRLVFSVEAEKNSGYRYSPILVEDMLSILGELSDVPDVVCTSGWWPGEAHQYGAPPHVGYRGVTTDDIAVSERRLFGREVRFFSSSHERSHIVGAFGMSALPRGTPCYALVWEGVIGAFYEIDADLNIRLIADVLSEPGNRYALLYGLADPTFPKDAPFSRFSDSGKLMALAFFSSRAAASADDEDLMRFLLTAPNVRLSSYEHLGRCAYRDGGVNDPKFRNLAGIFSDRLFNIFYRFAKARLKKRLPLLIAGGCGLNCDWNSKWRDSGLFTDIFVPPVANDSGSAIGTAIDAQRHFTAEPKIAWDVYAGLEFDVTGPVDATRYDVRDANSHEIAEMLAAGLILG